MHGQTDRRTDRWTVRALSQRVIHTHTRSLEASCEKSRTKPEEILRRDDAAAQLEFLSANVIEREECEGEWEAQGVGNYRHLQFTFVVPQTTRRMRNVHFDEPRKLFPSLIHMGQNNYNRKLSCV